MFKTLLTLFRGQSARFGEVIADENALLILDQQIRDAGVALERAKKALALAMAQDGQEAQRLGATESQIADLEQRVLAALEGGNETLAREGAEAIATLEDERKAITAARGLFVAEITRLKAYVTQAEQRIAALDRGRRIARASEAVRGLKRGRIEPSHPHEATLSEAEATLHRLRNRQTEAQAAEEALESLDLATRPATITERLAAEGFGSRLKTTGEDVLLRLKSRTAA